MEVTTPDRTEALRRLVHGTLMPGFVGTTMPAWVETAYAAGLASVCLYGSNVFAPGQLRDLCAGLRAGRPDLLLAVDEEGGDVTRLHYLTGSPQPGNALLGRVDDPEHTRDSAREIGCELAALGINLDLAPVVDVNSADDNPVIGVRSFGADATLVARHGAAWVAGLQEVGVAACAKHFPGHGDTVTDSHLALPRVDATLALLEARELEPFRAAVEAGTACVMTSHVVVSAVDPERPATFSPVLLGDILRGRLGFDGVVLSDALDMEGACADIGIPEAAVRALAAGCDLLCLGSDTAEELFLAVVEAVVGAVAEGRLSAERVEDAAQRVAALSARFPVPAVESEPVGAAGHPAEGAVATGSPPRGELGRGFEVHDSARRWLADAAPAVIVQVASRANLAVGHVVWGPAAAHLTIGEDDVPPGAKVAVVGRGLGPRHPAWSVAERLGAAGHPTIVVECGWPRGGADLVTFGGSRSVGMELGRFLGVEVP